MRRSVVIGLHRLKAPIETAPSLSIPYYPMDSLLFRDSHYVLLNVLTAVPCL